MRKTVLYIAMSLDGYIADEKGSVDFLNLVDKSSYNSFIQDVDCVVMGYKTYDQIVSELSIDKWAYEDLQSYVITHRKLESTDKICFVDDVCNLVSNLKKEDGKDIWICGGASIVSSLMKENLIDEYRITIAPILLGKGISLFNEFDCPIHLECISEEKIGKGVELIYKVNKL